MVPHETQDNFAPGDVFAGRYRMIARIGQGGMGEVWRADDLVLQTPVALKLIVSGTRDARQRILKEVRLARQITHPAVCRVFDVGEADGQVFFTMELVPGEDLATLMARVGRLPPEKVLDIARQLCGGLAAAHAQGVLHRDLKPANILVDDRGHVRITDFGIAITREEAARHTVVGTPRYMAPEQRDAAAPLSEQTDLFSVGVLLYELAVGAHPFAQPDRVPSRPSATVPQVDPRLDAAIVKAIAVDPRERPASARAMGDSLSPPAEPLPARRRPALLIAAMAAVALLAVAFIAPRLRRTSGGGLTSTDTIVLAQFANTTGEAIFDGTLNVALAVALEQSPFLKVLPDERIRETLQLMERAPDEPLSRAVAREVAQREQARALLAGSIARLGRNYVVALEAINAATGDVMAREQVEAASREEVLGALGRTAARLREKLGESLASIQKFDVPLARATTVSLEALHAYSLALDEGRVSVRLSAIPFLKQAIAIDPEFALAYALLSGVYANTDQPGMAPAFAKRAFELRDRVSERERYFIEWRYYRDATFAADAALETAQAWTATYPREPIAFNSLGLARTYVGRHAEAIEPFRTAMRLDPKFFASYGNVAETLIVLGRLDEAKEALRLADERGINVTAVRRVSYLLAFVQNDAADMQRQLQLASSVPESNGLAWQARAAVFGGRVAAAHDGFRRAIAMARQRGLDESAAQLIAEDAEAHAVVGQCSDVTREAAEGLSISRDNFTLQRLGRALALCGASTEALALSDELRQRFPDATLTKQVVLPVTSAVIALENGATRQVTELLEGARAYEQTQLAEFWPSYVRGQAWLRVRDASQAMVEFQRIVDHRGVRPTSVLFPLAHLGIARASALSGDVASARASYERFFALWKDADPALPPLQEARREFAALL